MPKKLSKKLSKKCVKKQVRITKKGGAKLNKLNKLNKSVKRGRPAKKSKKTMKGGTWIPTLRKNKGKSVANKYLNYSNTNPNPNNGAISASNQIVNTTFGSFGVNNKQSTSPEAASTTSTQIRRPHRPAPPPPTQTQIAAKAASTSTPQKAESCSRQKAKECAPCIARITVENNSEEEKRKFKMLSELGMVFVSLHDYDHDGYLTVKEGDLLFIDSEEDKDFYNNSNNADNFKFTNTRTKESGDLPKEYVMRYQATHTAIREVESDEASRINSDVTTSIGMGKDDKLILFASKETGVVKVYNMTRRAVGTVPEKAIEPSPAAAAEPEAAAQENEVSLKVDEEVEILEERDDGWTIVQKEDGKVGKVPTRYIEVIKAIKTVARYGYVPQDNTDGVSLTAGEEVEVLEEHNGGWIKVKANGKEGVVPFSYIVTKAKALYAFKPAASAA